MMTTKMEVVVVVVVVVVVTLAAMRMRHLSGHDPRDDGGCTCIKRRCLTLWRWLQRDGRTARFAREAMHESASACSTAMTATATNWRKKKHKTSNKVKCGFYL
jgi:hypothetical protein